MSYKILPTKEFVKEFRKLDNSSQQRIKNKMEEVSVDPTRYKHLHYELKNSCRIGTLRVIFSYDVRLRELYLETIVHDHKY